jgi:predicted AAA+ superfamily ATPase
MNYKPRIIDAILEDYVQGLPAVSLVGAKGVGKTSTAKRFAATVLELDVNAAARVIASNSGDLTAIKERPVLIDEWSREPVSWDVVRRIVDENQASGQFILTGSASEKGLSIHSGAARIVEIQMRPLSMEERQVSSPVVRLGDLLNGKLPSHLYEKSEFTLGEYAHEIFVSGFPGIRQYSDRMIKAQLNGYIAAIIKKEFSEHGAPVRKPLVLKSWMTAYAAATATTASYNTILRASTSGEDRKPSKDATLAYRDILDSLYITDRVEPWLPTDNLFGALGKTPKHYLVDSALAARLLRLSEGSLLDGTQKPMIGANRDNSVLGRLFENMVASSLKVYAQKTDADLFHLRTPDGRHEVDFIIEHESTIIGIEVKLSHQVTKEDVRHLDWLEARLAPDKRYVKVVINVGTHAYQRDDKTIVIPFALLGA